jgi:hypothetical protein
MSHFYGYMPQLETSLNLEPVVSWFAIILIGFLTFYMTRIIVKGL